MDCTDKMNQEKFKVNIEEAVPNGNSKNGSSQTDTVPLECPVQHGYSLDWRKCMLVYPLAVLTLGLGLLLGYWFPVYWIKLTCMRCSLRTARFVVVKDKNGKSCVESVRKVLIPVKECSPLPEEPFTLEFAKEDDEGSQLLCNNSKFFLKYFIHHHLRYVYDKSRACFMLLKGHDDTISCEAIYDTLSDGLTSDEHRDRFLRFGMNSIDVPVKPYHVLFFKEVLHPFYIFQVYAVAVWCSSQYYYYSGAVVFISAVSVLVSLIQTRRYMQQLHDMMKTSCKVAVLRNGQVVNDVPSETLVPGDVLVVPPSGMDVPCDAVLLNGQAIANESMLTGESVPVTKTPLPHDCNYYSPEKYKRHTLFCGTRVIQTRFYSGSDVTAVVVRTGFSTAKGGIVRSILFPKPINIKFFSDSIKFIVILAAIASLGFIYTIVYLQVERFSLYITISRALDVVTTAVPPALPAALTVGTVYAVKRLRKQNIFCISPKRIDLCGKVKLVCFDKTGTLTEDSLDVMGVKPAQNARFKSDLEDAATLPVSSALLQGLATSHSLTTIAGELSGDPLDIKMFEATKWTFEESSVNDSERFDLAAPAIVRPPSEHPEAENQLEIGILKQFPFSSELQRMSVIARQLPSSSSNDLTVFVKGAPEMIEKLCIPSSVPNNFAEELALLTQQGYRVLALAHKSIRMQWHKAEKAKRHTIECDLTFDGLLVMQNKLKEETTPVIHSLIQAAIRPVMVTGDNLLTAVSVARKCGMVRSDTVVIEVKAIVQEGNTQPTITYQVVGERSPTDADYSNGNHTSINLDDADSSLHLYRGNSFIDHNHSYHLAISGKTFAVVYEHHPKLLEKILVKGTIFARMSPDQKAQLVTSLMNIGYGVAMCGDGANDCGALKAAHAGISLSETEASVASPFTSGTPDITCVLKLIREGRASLVTSFSVFKFMALYSLTEFISVSILYAYESNLGDFQYLFVDLILTFAIIFVMGLTGPYPKLVKKRPPGTLASLHVFLSLITQVVLVIIFQVGSLLYLRYQYWYVPLVPDPNSDNVMSSENSVIFQVSNFQYIALAVALSTAAPFRKPLYTNYAFLLCLAVLVPICVYLTMAPESWWPWFWEQMQIIPHPSLSFRITLVEIALFHAIMTFIIERFIFPTEWMRKFLRILRCKKQPRNRYKHILAAIPTNWPSPIRR